jgi:hypothetical protein
MGQWKSRPAHWTGRHWAGSSKQTDTLLWANYCRHGPTKAIFGKLGTYDDMDENALRRLLRVHGRTR